MRSSVALALLLLLASAVNADTRLFTGTVLVEPGLAAPSLALRNIGADDGMWEFRIDGWTASASVERPAERRRVFLASITATPYSAHSSRRMYADGERERALEFDSASYTIRGGMRIRGGEHATTELAALAGRDVIGDDAPPALRERWDAPYAGLVASQRYARVTARDPFDGRIHGFELGAWAEVYSGKRTWSRLTLTESAGRPIGRVHLRQSAAMLAGSNLDTVSAFLVGGSWDLLGPTAVYGRHYAEYRIERGIVANAGSDYTLTPRWGIGVRGSALRAPSITEYGAAVQTTVRVSGIRLTVGVAQQNMFYATLTGAAFQW